MKSTAGPVMGILQTHHVLKRRTAAELTDRRQEPCQHIPEKQGHGHRPDMCGPQPRKEVSQGPLPVNPGGTEADLKEWLHLCCLAPETSTPPPLLLQREAGSSPAWRSGRSSESLAAAPAEPGRGIWKSGPGPRWRPGTGAGAIAETDTTHLSAGVPWARLPPGVAVKAREQGTHRPPPPRRRGPREPTRRGATAPEPEEARGGRRECSPPPADGGGGLRAPSLHGMQARRATGFSRAHQEAASATPTYK